MEKTPNIFDYATSELSQDAFLSWLFSWAENQYEKNVLHNCAIETLNLFMNTNLKKVNKVDVYKQEKHIDLIVSVDDKYFLVIEDKINSSEHDNQLIRYKETITDWLIENKLNDIEVKYAYYKTGILLTEEKKTVIEADYNLITVESIKSIFDRYVNSESEIFSSYCNYIKSLSEDYNSVINTSYEEYKNMCSENPAVIYSLYKNLEDEFKSDCWINKVNSPGRHCFYTFTFGWDRWPNADVYFELDGFELRFRLYNFRGKKNQKK